MILHAFVISPTCEHKEPTCEHKEPRGESARRRGLGGGGGGGGEAGHVQKLQGHDENTWGGDAGEAGGGGDAGLDACDMLYGVGNWKLALHCYEDAFRTKCALPPIYLLY